MAVEMVAEHMLPATQALEPLALPPGSRILVHGGSGGVGSLAVQLAKHTRGWHVTATCSPKNAAYCGQLGADVTEDYKDAGLWERYGRGSGEQFDVVLDGVGGGWLQQQRGGCWLGMGYPMPSERFSEASC